MRERCRQIVPFDEVADHRGGVLHRMDPLAAGGALRGIDRIADHHVDRHPIAPGIVERHRSVLQANCAVCEGQQRLALDLGIASRHCDGGFLVRARMPVDLEIIDKRFVKAAEKIAGVAGYMLNAEALDDVGHVVRAAGPLDDADCGLVAPFRGGIWRRRGRAGRPRLRLRLNINR